MSDTATSAPAPERLPAGRVPIVIGVTGHRSIASDDDRLRAVVERELKALAGKYPDTPFLVLSGLAEGADRLVAHVALDALPECRLIAVLPMPRADYEQDFDSDASRAEFATLMDRADGRIEIAPPAGEDWTVQGSDARNALYARGGAATAEHAQVLIALWDGQPPRGEGGTAWIVAWFKEGVAPKRYSLHEGELSPLDPPEPGLLIHITPDTGAAAHVPPERNSKIRGILKRTAAFNAQVLKRCANLEQAWPLPPGLNSDAPGARAQAERQRAAVPGLAALYDTADVLAGYFAGKKQRYDKWFYGLALVAFLFYNLRDADWLIAGTWVFFAAFLVFGVLAALVWGWVWWRGFDNDHHEYRALAEAMRVAFFWRLAGVTHPAWLSYLSKHSGVISWVRHAVRAVEFRHRAMAAALPGIGRDEGLRAARDGWVEDQRKYYLKAIERHRRAAARWKWAGRALLGLALVLAVGVALTGLSHLERAQLDLGALLNTPAQQLFGEALDGWELPLVQALLGVAAAAGLVARAYLIRRADEDLVKQYSAAAQIFAIALKEFDEAAQRRRENKQPDWERADILEQLGREALVEHGEWAVLRHSRPYEVPRG